MRGLIEYFQNKNRKSQEESNVNIAQSPRKRLRMQWHITDRCNLRCRHCYQESFTTEDLPFQALMNILGQYRELLKEWNIRENHTRARGHINVTGGEPFVRKDFFELLKVFHKNRDEFTYGILTNGTLLSRESVERLKELEPSFVQVSLEGGEETHDQIRGKGSFRKTLEGIRVLISRGIETLVSFTAHRENYREFPHVVKTARKLKVDRVWSDRLIPCGGGAGMKDMVLSPEQTREFFYIMKECAQGNFFTRTDKTRVEMNRGLQFLVAGGRPYSCAAGDTIFTITAEGELLPCRRMPIPSGNLLGKKKLGELYFENEFFKKLRDKQITSAGCRDCIYVNLCRGGLRCLAYAMTGDPFNTDPGCWKSSLPPV